ncbi:MAG: hypothetical protein Q4B26_02210 [Eubacteriales bacterium]|nr:hypothetical protein [Eubacteriales bacterium]
MYTNVSEEFANAIKGSSRTFRAYAVTDGIEMTGIRSLALTHQSTGDSYFTIGGTVSSVVSMIIQDPQTDLSGKELELDIGLLLPDGSYEAVPMGRFTAGKPESDEDGQVTITAYDRIQTHMAGAYVSKLSLPVDAKQVLSEISDLSNVMINTSNLPDGIMIQSVVDSTEKTVDADGKEIEDTTYVNPFEGYSIREVLGFVAQLYGKFAVADRFGNVVFRSYQASGLTIGTDRYYDDLVATGELFELKGISCTLRDGSIIYANENSTNESNVHLTNPGMTKNVLNAVAAAYSEFAYQPSGVSFLGDPRIDLGDIITIDTKKGISVAIPVMSITQDFDGGLITGVRSFPSSTEQELMGPTEQKIVKLLGELFKLKGIVGGKASFELAYGIQAKVTDLNGKVATMEFSTDKIEWAIEGEDKTSFTLSDGFAKLVTDSVTIKGPDGSVTIISGGTINLDELFAQTITATGKITASNMETTGGKIGQFKITQNRLYSDDNAENYVGMNISGKGAAFWAGGTDLTGGSAPFKVEHNGKTTVSNIEATGGKLGQFKITQNRLYSDDNAENYVGMNRNGYGQAFWAGGTDLTGGSAPFRVGHDGKVTAENIVIRDKINLTDATGGYTGEIQMLTEAFSTYKWNNKSGVTIDKTISGKYLLSAGSSFGAVNLSNTYLLLDEVHANEVYFGGVATNGIFSKSYRLGLDNNTDVDIVSKYVDVDLSKYTWTWTASANGMYYIRLVNLSTLGVTVKNVLGLTLMGWSGIGKTAMPTPYIERGTGYICVMCTTNIAKPGSFLVRVSYNEATASVMGM